jgi:hypothetical protein
LKFVLHSTATEAISKLFYLGRISDPSILSNLIIAFFSPATEGPLSLTLTAHFLLLGDVFLTFIACIC